MPGGLGVGFGQTGFRWVRRDGFFAAFFVCLATVGRDEPFHPEFLSQRRWRRNTNAHSRHYGSQHPQQPKTSPQRHAVLLLMLAGQPSIM
jgi:hypothetical protein